MLLLWSSLLVLCLLFGPSSVTVTYAQELARYQAETLSTEFILDAGLETTIGDVPRQDLCNRYEDFRNGTIELRDALDGLELNVLVMAYEGGNFRYDSSLGISRDYPGMSAILLDELARRAGFTWRNSFGVSSGPPSSFPENSTYRPSNSAAPPTWSDVLLWAVDSFDLCVDWWGQNLDRMNAGVVFLEEWYDDSIILITREQPKGKIVFWNFLRPYETLVWVVTILTVLASGLVYQLLEWLAHSRDPAITSYWEWWIENAYLSAINFTQAYEYRPINGPQRLFGISMSLWALVMTATYTANLASLLVDGRNPEPPVTTIFEAATKESTVCVWGGTNGESFLRRNYPTLVRIPQPSQLEVYQALLAGECEFAMENLASWERHKTQQAFNPFCNLQWVGGDRKVQESAAGFAAKADSGYKCTGLVRDVLNWHLKDMIDDGFLADAWEEEYRLSQDINCNTFQASDISEEEDIIAGRRLEAQWSGSRLLKGGTTSAAGGAVAIFGDNSDSGETLKLSQMIGTFFFHWALMALAVLLSLCSAYYDKRFGTEKSISNEQTTRTEAVDNAFFKHQSLSRLSVRQSVLKGHSSRELFKRDNEAAKAEGDSVELYIQMVAMEQKMDQIQNEMKEENQALKQKMELRINHIIEKEKSS